MAAPQKPDRSLRIGQDMSCLLCRSSLKAAKGFSEQRTLHFSLTFYRQDQLQGPLITEPESDSVPCSSCCFHKCSLEAWKRQGGVFPTHF